MIKWNGKKSPFSPVSISHNNIERIPAINLNLILSKKVNTHKGCWYQSWQDNNPSLTLSNQIKWQDITPTSPWFCFPTTLMMSSNKPESCFVKRVNSRKGCWYHRWKDHNPSLMLSNQIKWQDVMIWSGGSAVRGSVGGKHGSWLQLKRQPMAC